MYDFLDKIGLKAVLEAVKGKMSEYASKALYGDTTINVGRKAGTDVGERSTAEGHNTTASGGASHAEGLNTIASGAQSHAEGAGTIASGSRSHAEGVWTIASGGSNHAEGTETTANGNNSCHAEGSKTTASGIATHAEGNSSNKVTDLITDFSWNGTTNDDIINAWNTQKFSVAHGRSSHVEGSDNLSLGHSSHSEGHNTVAIGNQSHTSGKGTKALHDNEAAYGTYNKSNADTLFSIGDGTADDARHNAFEITTTGGKLHDKDIATTDLIPTELPANGGDADTVDGMHANDFITGETIQQRTTIDDCITGGTYAVSTTYTTDMPTIYGIWGICDVRVYGLGVFQTIKYTDTANVICRSKIVSQTEWPEWKRINDGGNAETVGGKSASDFVEALTLSQSANTRVIIPDNVDVTNWLIENAKIGTVYYINQNSQGQTNLPPVANISWVWFSFDGNRYLARVMINDFSTRDFLLDKVNSVGGWKEISTTPIKKMSFSSVATNAGGGGTLFSSDFGTPITIVCTSRGDTQCTPFLVANQWFVLAKDATTLDPIPAGSYSFDVWYI